MKKKRSEHFFYYGGKWKQSKRFFLKRIDGKLPDAWTAMDAVQVNHSQLLAALYNPDRDTYGFQTFTYSDRKLTAASTITELHSTFDNLSFAKFLERFVDGDYGELPDETTHTSVAPIKAPAPLKVRLPRQNYKDDT